ncbi:MAG: hypothetical protein II472_04645, partial [Lachnospiraceae bacterium]|nr:hypothetical protein [Lachnospiraceae bacterium]
MHHKQWEIKRLSWSKSAQEGKDLIINAVVNCSYLQGSLVQVAIYDNRLEISSPGGLMPGVTIEKMKEG